MGGLAGLVWFRVEWKGREGGSGGSKKIDRRGMRSAWKWLGPLHSQFPRWRCKSCFYYLPYYNRSSGSGFGWGWRYPLHDEEGTRWNVEEVEIILLSVHLSVYVYVP